MEESVLEVLLERVEDSLVEGGFASRSRPELTDCVMLVRGDLKAYESLN